MPRIDARRRTGLTVKTIRFYSDRRIVAPGPVIHFGEGEPLFERKIPAVALVTAPQYLLALRDADAATHVDLDAMVKQVESFRDLLDAFDATDTAAFGPVVSRSVFLPRISMLLLGAFAVSALLLAVVGIYGVVSYSVTQRTRELGVRMALGADSTTTLRLVLGKSMLLVAGGTVCGLIASFAITRAIAGLLFDVSPLDPIVFAGVSMLLATAGFVASLIPARRATRVDPIVALRVQ